MLRHAKPCPPAPTPLPLRVSQQLAVGAASGGSGVFVEDSMQFQKLAVRPRRDTVDEIRVYVDAPRDYHRATIADVNTPDGDCRARVLVAKLRKLEAAHV